MYTTTSYSKNTIFRLASTRIVLFLAFLLLGVIPLAEAENDATKNILGLFITGPESDAKIELYEGGNLELTVSTPLGGGVGTHLETYQVPNLSPTVTLKVPHKVGYRVVWRFSDPDDSWTTAFEATVTGRVEAMNPVPTSTVFEYSFTVSDDVNVLVEYEPVITLNITDSQGTGNGQIDLNYSEPGGPFSGSTQDFSVRYGSLSIFTASTTNTNHEFSSWSCTSIQEIQNKSIESPKFAVTAPVTIEAIFRDKDDGYMDWDEDAEGDVDTIGDNLPDAWDVVNDGTTDLDGINLNASENLYFQNDGTTQSHDTALIVRAGIKANSRTKFSFYFGAEADEKSFIKITPRRVSNSNENDVTSISIYPHFIHLVDTAQNIDNIMYFGTSVLGSSLGIDTWYDGYIEILDGLVQVWIHEQGSLTAVPPTNDIVADLTAEWEEATFTDPVMISGATRITTTSTNYQFFGIHMSTQRSPNHAINPSGALPEGTLRVDDIQVIGYADGPDGFPVPLYDDNLVDALQALETSLPDLDIRVNDFLGAGKYFNVARNLDVSSEDIGSFRGLEFVDTLTEVMAYSNYNLVGIGTLPSLPDNMRLTVSGSTSLTQIATMQFADPSLYHLYLNGCRISDLSPLYGNDNILNLYVAGNPIDHIYPISTIPNLALLDAGDLDLVDGYDWYPISNLTNLKRLRVRNNPSFDDIALEYASESFSSDLVELQLINTAVTDLTVITEPYDLGADPIDPSDDIYALDSGNPTNTLDLSNCSSLLPDALCQQIGVIEGRSVSVTKTGLDQTCTYDLTITPQWASGTPGTWSGTTPLTQTGIAYGTVINLSAINSGDTSYEFHFWSGDTVGNHLNSDTTITINGDKAVTAWLTTDGSDLYHGDPIYDDNDVLVVDTGDVITTGTGGTYSAIVDEATGVNNSNLAQTTITLTAGDNSSAMDFDAYIMDPPGFENIALPMGAVPCAKGRKLRLVLSEGGEDTRWFDRWSVPNTFVNGRDDTSVDFRLGNSNQVIKASRKGTITVTLPNDAIWTGTGSMGDMITVATSKSGDSISGPNGATYTLSEITYADPGQKQEKLHTGWSINECDSSCTIPSTNITLVLGSEITLSPTTATCWTAEPVRGDYPAGAQGDADYADDHSDWTLEQVAGCPTGPYPWTHTVSLSGGGTAYVTPFEIDSSLHTDTIGLSPGSAVGGNGPSGAPGEQAYTTTVAVSVVMDPDMQADEITYGNTTECLSSGMHEISLDYTPGAKTGNEEGPLGASATSLERKTIEADIEVEDGSAADAGYIFGLDLNGYYDNIDAECDDTTQLVELSVNTTNGYQLERWTGSGPVFDANGNVRTDVSLEAGDDEPEKWVTDSTIYLKCLDCEYSSNKLFGCTPEASDRVVKAKLTLAPPTGETVTWHRHFTYIGADGTIYHNDPHRGDTFKQRLLPLSISYEGKTVKEHFDRSKITCSNSNFDVTKMGLAEGKWTIDKDNYRNGEDQHAIWPDVHPYDVLNPGDNFTLVQEMSIEIDGKYYLYATHNIKYTIGIDSQGRRTANVEKSGVSHP